MDNITSEIKRRAFWYMSRYAYSTKELKEKLFSKGHKIKEIEEVLALCQEKGFLQDEELSTRRVEIWKKKGYGPFWIERMLIQAGLPTHPLSSFREEQVLEELLKKPSLKKKKLPQKYQFLQRRGFSPGAISRALQQEIA